MTKLFRQFFKHVHNGSDSRKISYRDLTNKPAIGSQVQSDWNVIDSGDLAFIKNKPTTPTLGSEIVALSANVGSSATSTFKIENPTQATDTTQEALVVIETPTIYNKWRAYIIASSTGSESGSTAWALVHDAYNAISGPAFKTYFSLPPGRYRIYWIASSSYSPLYLTVKYKWIDTKISYT